MNKKIKYLLTILCLFLFPAIVNADTIPSDAEKVITCEYSSLKIAKYPVGTTKFKMILYKDNANNYYIEKYKNASSGYTKTTNASDFFITTNGDGNVQLTFKNFDANTFKNYYDELGKCPYLETQYVNDSFRYVYMTNNKANSGNDTYEISEGVITIHDEDLDPPAEPVVTSQCNYVLDNENLIDNLYITLYMKSNGKKYWSIRTNSDESLYGNEQILDSFGNLSLKLSNGVYANVVLDNESVDKIFLQNDSQQLSNTFSCITENQLELELAGNNAYYIVVTNNNNNNNNNNLPTDNPGGNSSGTSGPNLNYNSLCENDGIRNGFKLIGYIISIVKWIVPLIIIVLGMIDFGKAIISNDEKAISIASSSLIKRIVAGVIVFFVPTIILAALNIIEITNGIEDEENSRFGLCTKCLFDPKLCEYDAGSSAGESGTVNDIQDPNF